MVLVFKDVMSKLLLLTFRNIILLITYCLIPSNEQMAVPILIIILCYLIDNSN